MFGIVIDKQGFKIEFVVLSEDKTPQYYELKEGESVIEKDWQVANSMNKPKWDGEKWVDTDPLPPVEVEPQPSEIDILKQEVEILKESQSAQDFLIDDIVFEVIPSLETQIASATNPNEAIALISKNIKNRGDGMAAYLAKKIIEGRDYRAVFRTNAYKQYQDEVDTILELEGRGDLIKR